MPCPLPGPGEFVSAGIQGNPIFSVGVRIGAAVASKMVGGSGKWGCCSCGSVGLTSTMDESGGGLPLVGGTGFWPPPRLPPSDGRSAVRLRKTVRENMSGDRGVVSCPALVGCRTGPCVKRKKSRTKRPACVSNEAPWARAGRRDLSNFRRWMGAPFAELGFKCEGISSCPRLSRTRLSQEFAGEGLVATSLPERERKSGSRMRRPPSPPRDSAKQRQEAGTSRLVRSSQETIGCLLRRNRICRQRLRGKRQGQYGKRKLV